MTHISKVNRLPNDACMIEIVSVLSGMSRRGELGVLYVDAFVIREVVGVLTTQPMYSEPVLRRITWRMASEITGIPLTFGATAPIITAPVWFAPLRIRRVA